MVYLYDSGHSFYDSVMVLFVVSFKCDASIKDYHTP